MKKNKEQAYKITCIILIIDQILKNIIKTKMSLNQEIVLIKNFLSINYLKNTGAAFSILTNQTLILIIISFIIIFVLDRFLTKEKNLNNLSVISIGLILGGIFGNLLDRILYKGVIDYLSFRIFSYNFPVFNFADMAITIGTFLLLFNMVKEEIQNKKLDKENVK